MRVMGIGLLIVGFSTSVVVFLIGRAEASVTLTPSLALSERYSDNFFFSPQNPEGDFTTIIAPAVDLTIANQDVSLSTRYHGGAEFSARHPETDLYSQALDFGLDLPVLSRQIEGMQVRVIETTTYTPELPAFSLSNEAQEANEGIQTSRTDTFRNRAGIAVTYPWSHLFSTIFSYTNLLTRYRGDTLQDFMVHEMKVLSAYQQSPRTRWVVGYGVAKADYARSDNVFAQQVTGGVKHLITHAISIDGELGVSAVRDESAHAIADIGAQKSLRSGSVSLRYSRAIGTGGGLVSSATLNHRVSGKIAWDVAKNTSASVDAAYGKNVSLSQGGLDIFSYEAGASIDVLWLSWLKGSLTYSYFSQDAAGVVGTDGKRNLILLTLTATGSSWRVIK